jgi:hypothetical protein
VTATPSCDRRINIRKNGSRRNRDPQTDVRIDTKLALCDRIGSKVRVDVTPTDVCIECAFP